MIRGSRDEISGRVNELLASVIANFGLFMLSVFEIYGVYGVCGNVYALRCLNSWKFGGFFWELSLKVAQNTPLLTTLHKSDQKWRRAHHS